MYTTEKYICDWKCFLPDFMYHWHLARVANGNRSEYRASGYEVYLLDGEGYAYFFTWNFLCINKMLCNYVYMTIHGENWPSLHLVMIVEIPIFKVLISVTSFCSCYFVKLALLIVEFINIVKLRICYLLDFRFFEDLHQIWASIAKEISGR